MKSEEDSSQGKRVDIFSHSDRLIYDGNNYSYLRAFEKNNLLAYIANNPERSPHCMAEHLTSFPLQAGSPESPKTYTNLDVTEGRINTDENGRTRCLPSPRVLAEEVNTVCIERASDLKKNAMIPKSKCFPSRPPMLPPCRVCGDAASGFHYGVNTCEACKGFFRRSIIKSTPHVCIGSGTCKMFLGRRTSCSACRYKRCLDVGMSKHAIKTGRYTHELRSKNILEVKRLQKEKREETPDKDAAKTFEASFSTAGCQNNCQSRFDRHNSDEYASVLDSLVEGQTCLFEELDEYYDTDLMLQRQSAVFERYREESNAALLKNLRDPTEELKAQVLSTFMEDMKRSVKGMLAFAKIIPGFVDLPNEDQVVIIQVPDSHPRRTSGQE